MKDSSDDNPNVFVKDLNLFAEARNGMTLSGSDPISDSFVSEPEGEELELRFFASGGEDFGKASRLFSWLVSDFFSSRVPSDLLSSFGVSVNGVSCFCRRESLSGGYGDGYGLSGSWWTDSGRKVSSRGFREFAVLCGVPWDSLPAFRPDLVDEGF